MTAPEEMIDNVLARGMGKIRRARVIGELLTATAWIATVLLAVTVIALIVQGATGDDPDALGYALAVLFVGGVQTLLLFGFASLVDLTAAKLEVELWQSPLFEDDEDHEEYGGS